MKAFLRSIDDNVWYVIEDGFSRPVKTNTDYTTIPKPRGKWNTQVTKISNWNSKAVNALFCGVDDYNFWLIQNCEIAKQAWDILETTHEGTIVVKRFKPQMLTTQFKMLRMEENEGISDFHAKLIDITNKSSLLGEEYLESDCGEDVDMLANEVSS
ncbi:hypothetical protein UlMin_039300 [Ulmus minor]